MKAMIFRALFCIAVVWMLIPHEPDLGFGRPGTEGASAMQSAGKWAESSLTATGGSCSRQSAMCVAALGVLDSVQSVTVKGLAQVKADIEAAQRERARHGRGTDRG
jgi:hypothetical protein